MTDFIGTPAVDRLIGTPGDDTFFVRGNGGVGFGTADKLIGRNGTDTYTLAHYGVFNSATGVTNYDAGTNYYVINDRGSDGASDTIEASNGLFITTSTGAVSTYAEFVRSGDNLTISLPGSNSWWRHSGTSDMEIRIVGQYSGTGIETLNAGGVAYNLITGDIGTAVADIIVGDNSNDEFSALDGDDYVYGNGGHDSIDLGAGDDVAYGGNGRDTILGGQGQDRIYGGSGGDRIFGGDGNDSLNGEAGNDRIWGNNGDDNISGGDGRDVLRGGSGADILAGDAGDDILIGGRGADTYIISLVNAQSGTDTIREAGSAGTWLSHDTLEVGGIGISQTGNSHPNTATFDGVNVAQSGLDAVLTFEGSAATVTIEGQLDSAKHDRSFVEELVLRSGSSGGYQFQFVDGTVDNLGNDRDFGGPFGASSTLNEILFGTIEDDEIFGGTGINFVVTGDGADTLIYKVGDGAGDGLGGGGVSHDIVMDFDLAQDVLDFSEVTGELGEGNYYLEYGEDAQGDATIYIDTGNFEVADIMIELRDVSLVEFLDADVMIF